MVKYIIKRILWTIPVLLVVIIAVFTIVDFTPGDPIYALYGSNITDEQYELKAIDMGLDGTFGERLGRYLLNIVTKLDFGKSYINKRSVTAQIAERVKPSLIIGIFSVLLSQIIAIPIGVAAATHHQRPFDYGVITGCVIFSSIPMYIIAVFLMLIFCLKLQWLPAAGISTWKHYILPVASGLLGGSVQTIKMTRSSMLEVIRQDYIRTARAKGVPERTVIYKHALKNGLIPVLTMIGMQVGGSMGGSILTETVFTIPGMGILLKEATTNLDFPVIMGCIIFMTTIMALMNLLTDIVYGLVDPRVYVSLYGGARKTARKKSGRNQKEREGSAA